MEPTEVQHSNKNNVSSMFLIEVTQYMGILLKQAKQIKSDKWEKRIDKQNLRNINQMKEPYKRIKIFHYHFHIHKSQT